MKYVQINTVPNGSTGGIMMKKHRELLEAGEDSYVFWGRGREAENERECKFGSQLGVYADAALTRLDGKAGFHSKAATKELLRRLDEINPDVVHLHNLHGYYLNIEMLFDWLKQHHCKIIWTLHDCWSFTGHCSHFTYVKCEQWKSHCSHCKKCPQIDAYPATISAQSVPWSFKQKERLFTSLPEDRMTIVTPSHWLEGLVKESFLAKYPVQVIHNTIDTNVFKPTPSDFRERCGLEDKFVVLGVASPWTERKGLETLVQLSRELDERFAVVLVGLSRSQLGRLPDSVVGLSRLESATALAEAYSAADLYVQPSAEETYGMTVAEAVACGTPVAVRAGSACVEAAQGGVVSLLDGTLPNLVETVVHCAS